LRRPAGAWATQAVLAAVGVYVAASSSELGIWMPEGPGPGFFPLVLAIGLVLLSVAWFVQTPRLEPAPSGDQRALWRASGITIASLIVLAVVLELIGFQVSMFAFLMFHLRWLGKVRWVTAVTVSLLGSVGAFHLFSDLLLVPLPVATVPPLTMLGI
jgi:hypothetical protein